jgi:hypothetical protein
LDVVNILIHNIHIFYINLSMFKWYVDYSGNNSSFSNEDCLYLLDVHTYVWIYQHYRVFSHSLHFVLFLFGALE